MGESSQPHGEQTATMRAVILLAVLCCAGASHYGKAPCQSDETSFLINADQGASVCAAKCGPEEQCPEDTPAGTKAKPRCALRDSKGTKYCAITCFLNGKCPPTAECTRPAGAIIGYCAYPNATVQESNLAVTPLEHVDVVPNKAFAALIDSWTSVVDSAKGGCAKPGACGLVYQGCCFGAGRSGDSCTCKLTDGSGEVGSTCTGTDKAGACGLAYTACCAVAKIKGQPCTCDVESA